MSNYKTIKGRTIQSLASDVPTAFAGQLWYNTTSGAYKGVVGSAAWASGVNMLVPASGSGGGTGTQTSAIIMATGASAQASYTYNGTSWTSAPTLSSNQSIGSAGGASSTSAIYCGGYTGPPAYSSMTRVEEFSGTAWTTNPTTLNTARKGQGGGGFTTEAVWVAAGVTHPPSPGTNLNSAETFNGSTWTTAPGTMTHARQYVAAAGSSTAAVVAGGQIPPPYSTYDLCELFDGSTWTAGGTLNQSRKFPRGNGTQTAAAAYGGNGPPSAPQFFTNTELFDGTSWANSVVMATGRAEFSSAVTAPQMTAMAIGGETPSATNAVEELGMVDTVKTITTS